MRFFGSIPLAVAIAAALSSCHLDEDLLELRQPLDLFYVTSVSPENGHTDIPLNQPLSVTFNDYLDASSFEYYNALTVRSGSISGRGIVRYEASTRTLTYFPYRDLRPNLIYSLSINPDTVRSIRGLELSIPFSVVFQTASDTTVEQNRQLETISYEQAVAPILSNNCGCHSDLTADLTGLTYENLVENRAVQVPSRYLVRPFDPDRSYLLHKVLPSYPDRRFMEMPPEWSTNSPLPVSDLLTIERWIETGANP